MANPLSGPYTYDRQKVSLRGADGQQIAAVVGSLHTADPANCPACATGDLLAASWAFLTACTQERDTVSRLEWLAALLSHLRQSGEADRSEDPDAAWTALRECEALLADLRAAAGQARGETL